MSVSLSVAQVLSQRPYVKPLHELESTHRYVAFNEIEKKEEEIISQRYDLENEFKKLGLRTRVKIVLNSELLDLGMVAATVTVTTGLGTGIGALCGWAAEYLRGKPKENLAAPVDYKIVGGILGGLLGAKIGSDIATKQFVKRAKITILQSQEFSGWKEACSKEKYDLFLNCLKNYANMNAATLEDFECAISRDIPEIPVISPNGHVYEKKLIEAHLDKKWTHIQNLINQGHTQKRINEELETVCPLRGKPFTKEDLKYAAKFSKDALKAFREIKDQLSLNNDQNKILAEGLMRVIAQYEEMHQAVTDEIISSLTQDIVLMGATDDQRRILVAAFREKYRMV